MVIILSVRTTNYPLNGLCKMFPWPMSPVLNLLSWTHGSQELQPGPWPESGMELAAYHPWVSGALRQSQADRNSGMSGEREANLELLNCSHCHPPFVNALGWTGLPAMSYVWKPDATRAEWLPRHPPFPVCSTVWFPPRLPTSFFPFYMWPIPLHLASGMRGMALVMQVVAPPSQATLNLQMH
jgi:hypothetical protein